MSDLASPPAQPFFLPAKVGERYCLFHEHAPNKTCRGSIIYVHPFAEEMNRSRRMAALQSRAFAARGYNVMQIDLYGCGDSSGAFQDACWHDWKEDIILAQQWCQQRSTSPVVLWGLRLGALLALDYAMSAAVRPEKVVLWQPVINGDAYLTQLLRIRMASAMLDGTEETLGVAAMRGTLASGHLLEIAGYMLTPAMAATIDSLELSSLLPNSPCVHWFERVHLPGSPLPPAVLNTLERWRSQQVVAHVHPVAGTAFWSSPETGACPALLAATSRIFDEVAA